jgi:hypothetical protein
MGSPVRTLCLAVAVLLGLPTARGAIELIREGASSAVIRVDAEPTPIVLAAADTLSRYLLAASGATLPVVLEGETVKPSIILEVGATCLPGLDVKALGRDGFWIKTADGDLYLTTNTEDGLQNAVYTFLETYLGCRKYSPWVTVIPPQSTVCLPEIDDRQVPPIAFRMQDFHESAYNAWHKLDTYEDFGLFVHTFHTLVPPEVYFADHPEYFSLLKG